MNKIIGLMSDWLFLYAFTWLLILASPIWLPIWGAVKLRRWSKEVGNGFSPESMRSVWRNRLQENPKQKQDKG